MTGSTLPSVAVVHGSAGAASVPEIVRAADGWCRPVFVFEPATVDADPDLVAIASRVAEVVVETAQDVARSQFARRFDAVCTFNDAYADVVDGARDDVGVDAMRSASRWDKAWQRRALVDHGLSTVYSTPVESADDVARVCARRPGRYVLKPRRGAGGRGVTFVDDARDVARLTGHPCSSMVLEELIDDGEHPVADRSLGDFVSIEVASHGVEHELLAVFDKVPPSIVKDDEGPVDSVLMAGDRYPSALDPPAVDELVTLTRAALDVLGVHDQVTHTEIKLGPRGPEIIEINGRLGGDLARLTRIAGGPDLVRSALLAALGGRADRAGTATSEVDGAAAGYYPTFLTGTGPVASDVRVPEIRGLAGVRGVAHLARRGSPRSAGGRRAVDLTIGARSPGALGAVLCDVARDVDQLFHADPIGPRSWLDRLPGPTRPSMGQSRDEDRRERSPGGSR